MGKVQVEADIPQIINYVATTVSVGSTTTLSTGSNATVTNSGTNQNAILDFGIPKGKDAYESAVTGGYSGTEQEFNAALASDITTVANNISDINTVGADITNVNTVAGNTTNIDKVAAIDSDVTIVAGISSDVTNVASIKNAVVAVNANESKINTVYDNLANVNTVASNITNVNTVSGVSSDVTTVAGISIAVSTVSTNVASVSSVATNISNVNAVAANESNINAVNANKTNIDTVAGISSDVTTVAGSSTAVSTVSSNISDVNTAATNISAIIAAPTQASNAAASATKAQKWAEGADADVSPLGGTHSAKGWAETAASTLSGKQDTLVSGTNIKTVNNNSLLGSGNINIDSLPSQTGNNGKFLTTDGSVASWATIPEVDIDGNSITKNLDNELQAVAVIEQNNSYPIKEWVGTKQEYDSIQNKDSRTRYEVTDETDATSIVVDSALSNSSENPLQNKAIYTAMQAKQDVSNLVTSVSSSSTDAQYPSAKLFYDTCGDIETLINAL